jgi:hypothetical protein
LLILSESM